MSSLFDRIRSGAGKAAFEADKLRRINAIQSTIRSLKTKSEKATYQIGHVAFALYQEGNISQSQLEGACERLAELQAQIASYEQEVEAIRAEVFVESVTESAYGRVCPNGHGPIPPDFNFCQECGAKAVEIPPPAAPSSGVVCQHCGTDLAPGVRFCSNCGRPALDETPAPQSSFCLNCGSALSPGAAFCAECGHQIATETEVESQEIASPILAAKPEEESLEGRPSSESAFETFDVTSDSTDAGEFAVGESPPAELEPTEQGVEEVYSGVSETAGAEAVASVETTAEEAETTEGSQQDNPDRCPVCDTSLLPDAAFCAECGHSLATE